MPVSMRFDKRHSSTTGLVLLDAGDAAAPTGSLGWTASLSAEFVFDVLWTLREIFASDPAVQSQL